MQWYCQAFAIEVVGQRTNIAIDGGIGVLILAVIGKTYITDPPYCL